MSAFWNFVTTLTPGTNARAEDVNTNLAGIAGGFNLVEVEINKAIQVTNAAGVTDIVLNASARANKLLAFDVNGDIAASQILGDWQGNHAAAAGTDYQIRDVVKDSTGAVILGNIYICTATHTSTGTLATDSANWDLLVDVAGLADAGTLDGLDSTQFLRSDAIQDGRLQITRTATTDSARIIHGNAADRGLYVQQDGLANGIEVYSNAASRTGALLRLINDNSTGSGRCLDISQDQGGAAIYSDSLAAAAESGHFRSNEATRTTSVLRVENLNSTGSGRAVEITQNQGGAGLYSTAAINTAESGHFHSNTASRVTSVLRVENLNATGAGAAFDVSQSQGGHAVNSEANNAGARGLRVYSDTATRTVPIVEIINDNATGAGAAQRIQQDQGGHALDIESNNAGARAMRAYSNTVDRTVPVVDVIADVDSFDAAALRVEGDIELAGSSGLKGGFIQWIRAAQIGNDLNIANIFFPAITALNGTDIAFIDQTNDDLRTYRFDGTSWSQVGNDLNLTGVMESAALATLSSSEIAFVDAGLEDLRKYSFDGTNWSQVGNDLNISGIEAPAITALNSTDIAFIDETNDDLRLYRFDGTDWAQIGNDLNIAGGVQDPTLTTLNGADVAFIDGTGDDLRVYRFDGTDWAQIGNDLNIPGSVFHITALNGTDIAYIDGGSDDLRIYRFDGTDWTRVSDDLNITGGILNAPITALNGTDIAYIDQTNDDLRTYRFAFSIGAGPHMLG